MHCKSLQVRNNNKKRAVRMFSSPRTKESGLTRERERRASPVSPYVVSFALGVTMA